ncbi:MAG: hypothetical protein Q8N33_10055 [Rhodocyclaceae bacterium]|nr:hypothetical protein [Rhodocyclaceae bacterium]
MNFKQDGFINGSVIVLLIGGLMLGGLLVYGAKSGQELPFWPAIAVAVVNLVAAAKIVIDTKKARRQKHLPKTNTPPDDPRCP